jgi:hypothetical protein
MGVALGRLSQEGMGPKSFFFPPLVLSLGRFLDSVFPDTALISAASVLLIFPSSSGRSFIIVAFSCFMCVVFSHIYLWVLMEAFRVHLNA